MALTVYNTLTHQLEDFQPAEAGKVRMYNCGPTVYKDQHIGNFRAYLLADLLRRYFDSRGFEVTQIMNITDVGHLTTDDVADAQGEDKLEQSARELGIDPWQIARRYEEAFKQNIADLGVTMAHEYPRATDHVPEMISMIETLIEREHAYVVDGVGVYFRVSTFAEYGKLSGNTLDDLNAGARIEVDDRKESAADFALWKIDEKHLMQWESPWGRGFPGWHIECSAMSLKYLGDTFDIHTGGEDNIFPHHECERAQSLCSTAGEFSRYWVHTRHLLVDNTKMSKSLGNVYTLDDLQQRGYSGIEVRYALITSHYRQQANFTLKGLEDSRKALRRLCEFYGEMKELAGAATTAPSNPSHTGVRPEVAQIIEQGQLEVDQAFDQDLNISGALGAIFERIPKLRRERLGAAEASAVLQWLRNADAVLGVIVASEGVVAADLSEQQQQWIADREQARRDRDFGRADELRDLLLAQGIVIKDTAGGTEWSRN